MESKYIPGFPVVAIKENERLTTNINASKSLRTLKSSNGVEFKFLDDCFDNSLPILAEKTLKSNVPDSKMLISKSIYQGSDGWQRDYIYYDITPSTTRGKFSYDYQEHIYSFRMNSTDSFNKISDQSGDPSINLYKNPWIEGYFEFKVRTLFNASNGLGNEHINYFHATADELYNIQYEKTWLGKHMYFPEKFVGTKTKELSLPLFNWDLNEYASSIKIDIEEVDRTETVDRTDTRSVKYATNFAIEGVLKKIGLKFGASLERTSTSSIKTTYTEGNDELGSVIINFGDKFLLDAGGFRQYNSGWYTIEVAPKRVQ